MHLLYAHIALSALHNAHSALHSAHTINTAVQHKFKTMNNREASLHRQCPLLDRLCIALQGWLDTSQTELVAQ